MQQQTDIQLCLIQSQYNFLNKSEPGASYSFIIAVLVIPVVNSSKLPSLKYLGWRLATASLLTLVSGCEPTSMIVIHLMISSQRHEETRAPVNIGGLAPCSPT